MTSPAPTSVSDPNGVGTTPAATPTPNPSHIKKTTLWVICGALIALAVLATGFLLLHRSSPAKPQTYSGPVEKLRIGNVGEYSVFNLIAKEKGLFAQNGIDATITEYSSGAPSIADLLAGKEDVAIAGDFVGVTNIFNSKDLRILAQTSDQQVFQVLARKDKGISTPSDLKGKKVGVTRKTAGEFFLGRFSNQNNLALSDFTIVNLAPADMVAKLKTGELDAVVIFEPHAYNLKKDMANQLVVWSAQGNEATLGLLYSTDPYIKAHPDVIKRYLTALSQAQDLLNADPQTAKNILAHSLSYEPAYVEYLWGRIHFDLSLSQELLLTMEDQARFAIANKLTTQTTVPNYLPYIYFAGLEQVKPEAIDIVH